MTPRPDVSEERKAQILEAAVAVFARQGFDGARMDDIAAEAELSKGALYWYFDSKDALITALLDELFAGELAWLERLPGDPRPAQVRLLEFAGRTADEIDRFNALLPITYEFYALAFRRQQVRESILRYWRAYLDTLAPVIAQGIEAGEFQPLEPQMAARALGALVEGSILLAILDPQTRNGLRQQLEDSVHLFINGLLAAD